MRKEKYSEEKNSLKGIQAEENENHNGKEAGGEYSKRKYAEWDILWREEQYDGKYLKKVAVDLR